MSARIGRRLSSLASLVLLAGCVEKPESTVKAPDPEAAFRARLDHPWELVRVGAKDIPAPPAGTLPDAPGRDLVAGRRPVIRFSSDTVPGMGGRSFCNGFGGPYQIRGDSLRIGETVSTAVGCDSRDSLETRFFRGLRETRRFELNGDTLVLIAGDGSRLVFVKPPVASSYP